MILRQAISTTRPRAIVHKGWALKIETFLGP
jgi:hypothetical protein